MKPTIQARRSKRRIKIRSLNSWDRYALVDQASVRGHRRDGCERRAPFLACREAPGSVFECRATKITIERPRGLKANLQRLLQQRTEEDMQRVVAGEERYRRLFFSLCWLHALLVERGKFHNVGWNTTASFSDSDFFVGDSLLATYCEQVFKMWHHMNPNGLHSVHWVLWRDAAIAAACWALCVSVGERISLGSRPLSHCWRLLWRPAG